MTSIAPVSRTELSQRRQKLRRQRRTRFFQASWRNVAIAGFAVGALWVATLPAWVIRKPEQVTIKGNRFISEQTIRTLLPIAYPQSLLKVQPQSISDALKAKAPIANATVDRQLFPPSLTVRVQERIPIAQTASSSKASQPGLLDETGAWMPQDSYTTLNPNFKLPTLRIIGNPEQYRPNWATFYRSIRQSPVKTLEANWEDPTNLILKTELGTVQFGVYGSNFPAQLKVLDEMRRLPSRVNAGQILSIDLRNPNSPLLQMNATKTPVKLGTP
ncbi:MAG: FtsQ-type POTRA domain-containing protein [Plectolyngbya sp. WJT66-NPBG17]|jgi:cell division protein FtsQ|nr:FtsQ-type POTRA domain-containing protein [Plectolyngbya sp. WJT66-NPBG17]MBW4524463.1 FtsQ-type POTRA domain-containing protein [Phormidium tanganyikae FI6-MK23]